MDRLKSQVKELFVDDSHESDGKIKQVIRRESVLSKATLRRILRFNELITDDFLEALLNLGTRHSDVIAKADESARLLEQRLSMSPQFGLGLGVQTSVLNSVTSASVQQPTSVHQQQSQHSLVSTGSKYSDFSHVEVEDQPSMSSRSSYNVMNDDMRTDDPRHKHGRDILQLDEEVYEDGESIFKQVYRELHCKNHPDIICNEEEEVFVPTMSKWFKLCSEWGDKDDNAIKAHIKAQEQVYEIRTNSFYMDGANIGLGAMLRDSCQRPIVGWSKLVSEDNRVSSFYHQLEGVSLGIKLAEEYDVSPFYLYCMSEDVAYYVMASWRRRKICVCGQKLMSVETPCKECNLSLLFSIYKKDHEKIYELFLDISSDLQELYDRGLAFFDVSGSRRNENDGAYWLAKNGKGRRMKLSEISDCEGLAECLYQDVFGIHFQ